MSVSLAFWVDHPVEFGDPAVRIGDHRKIERVALRFGDVAGPGVVILDVINAQPNHLGIALVELGFEAGDLPELGRADGREVLGVGKEDRPVSTHPLMKTDLAFGRLGLEVRRCITKLQRHALCLLL